MKKIVIAGIADEEDEFTTLEEWLEWFQSCDGPEQLEEIKWFNDLNPTLVTQDMIACDCPDTVEGAFRVGMLMERFGARLRCSMWVADEDNVMPMAKDGKTMYWGIMNRDLELQLFRPDHSGRIQLIGYVEVTRDLCQEMQTTGGPVTELPEMSTHLCVDPSNWGTSGSPFQEMWG